MSSVSQRNVRIFWQIAISDFKLRYNNSILGYLWTLIKPLLLFGILFVVFSFFMRFPVQNYALHLLAGVILWNFFTEATSISLQSFVNKAALITKIFFPRYLIVLAATTTSLLTLLLNMLIFFIFLVYSGVGFHWANLLLPLYLVLLYLFTLGLSFILSALFVRFRDLSHIWEVLLQIGFWLTPIIYTVSVIPEKYHFWIMLNPIAQVIEATRKIFVLNEIMSVGFHLQLIVVCLLTFFVGGFLFQKLQPSLAEKI